MKDIANYTREQLIDEIEKLRNQISGTPVSFPGLSVINKYEHTLQEKQDAFQSLINYAVDAIFIANDNGFYIEVNESACKLLGFTKEELLQMHMDHLIPIGDDPHNLERVKKGEVVLRERRFITKSGPPVHVEVNKKMLPDGRIQAIARDISERKQIENALKESEDRFRKFHDVTTEAIIFHENGIITETNQAALNLAGYSEEETIGKSALLFVHPDDQERVKQMIMEGGEQRYEAKAIRKDGETIQCELRAKNTIHNNRAQRVVIIRDITEQKNQEFLLKQREEQYKLLFKKNPLPMWVYDPKTFEFLEVNDTAVNHYGYSEKEFLSKTLMDIRPTEGIQRLLEHVSKPGDNSPVYQGEWKHRTKQNKLIDVEITKGSISLNGKYANLAIINDITEKKKVEESLRHSQRNFRRLLEKLPVGVVIFVNEKIVYGNSTAFQTLGFEKATRRNFKGTLDIYNYFLPEYQEEIKKQNKAILQGAEFGTTEVKARTVSGNIIDVEIKSTTIDFEGKAGIQTVFSDISKRKNIELSLTQSQKNLSLLLDNIEEMVYYVEFLPDGTKKVKHIGPHIEKILGLSSHEYLNDKEKLLKCYHPEDFPKMVEISNKIKESKIPHGLVYRFFHSKLNKFVWLEERVFPQVDENNNHTGNFGITRDVTDRVNAERVLQKSEEKYRLLFENNMAGVFRTTTSGLLIECNDAFYKMFGYSSSEEMKSVNTSDLYINHIERDVYVERLKKEKNLKNYQAVYKTKEGKELVALASVILIEDKESKTDYIQGTLIDVTEIERTRQHYQALIEQSPDGVFIHKDGKFVFANPRACEIFEVESLNDLKDKSVFDFMTHEYVKECKDRVEKLNKGERVGPMEIIGVSAKGTHISAITYSHNFFYMGEPAIMVVIHDLAVQKQLFKEQMRAQVAEEVNLNLQEEIKERRKVEKRLVQMQQYTRNIIDSSLDIICASNKNGLITEFNKAAQDIFEFEPEEVIGKHISMLFENSEQMEKVHSEIMHGNGSFAGEITNITKSGRSFVTYLSASALKNEKGETIGSMGVSRDITKIKQAEKELRESEEKYRALFTQAYVGIARVSLEGKFIKVNEKLAEMFGYSLSEFVGKTFMEVSHPEKLELSIKYRDLMVKGEIDNFTIEKKYIHKNGHNITVNLTTSIVRDINNKPDYFVSVFHDITEKKKTAELIEAQSAKHNAIIESSSHLIWTTDAEHRLTSFNQNFKRAIRETYDIIPKVGLAMNEAKMVKDTSHNDYWTRKYEEAFKGIPQHFEVKMVEKDGTISWREIHLNPIFGYKKTIKEVSGIAHDITEKKLTEEKIKQSLKEKEVLLKEVHHRVKNNLQVISSILNLQSSYIKDKNTLNLLRESQNRIKSMAFIHESLYQTKDFSSINFSDYIVNLSRNLVLSYIGYDSDIKLKLDVEQIHLNLDTAIPCGLIINELVSNSLKYAFPKKQGELIIGLHKSGDEIKIIVSDDGVGLPKDLDFRNTESLGLQLVVTLVDQLNGKISLANKKGAKYVINFKEHTKEK